MRLLLPSLAVALAIAAAPAGPSLAAPGEAPAVTEAGRLEFDGRSTFSHIRIRRQGNVRSLVFVRDTGEEALETRVDLRRPHVLQFNYLRFLFASYLLQPHPSDVLIIGLGGGGMVHFLRRHDPQVRIDAVEIDPLVVELADRFFDVRPADGVSIVTADGLEFIAAGDKLYDVIFMDAFLRPSAATDSTGAPLELRTQQFYAQLQRRLKPEGVVMFNLNPHAGLAEDLRGIGRAFPQTYEFALPAGQGAVVAATTATQRVPAAELVRRGRDLERRFDGAVQFSRMPQRLRREQAVGVR